MIKYFGQSGAVDRVREQWKQLTPINCSLVQWRSVASSGPGDVMFLGVASELIYNHANAKGQGLHQRRDLSQKLPHQQTC